MMNSRVGNRNDVIALITTIIAMLILDKYRLDSKQFHQLVINLCNIMDFDSVILFPFARVISHSIALQLVFVGELAEHIRKLIDRRRHKTHDRFKRWVLTRAGMTSRRHELLRSRK
jgi:hypothetical protein